MLTRSRLLGPVLAVGLLAWAAAAGEPPLLDRAKAQARLKELQDRFDKVDNKDRESLRLDLLRLQQQAPGTPAALAAARLVMRLPSPLDELDAANIPREERPSWLPKEVVAVLGSQRGRSWGEVTAAALGRDGKYLVTASPDGLRLWNAGALNELAFVRTSEGTVRSLALSPDGRTLVTVVPRPRVAGKVDWQVWDVTPTALELRSSRTGAKLESRLLREDIPPTLLPDNKTLLLLGPDGFEFWDVSDFPAVKRKSVEWKDLGSLRAPDRGAISADGTTVVFVRRDPPSKTEDKKPGETESPRAYLTVWNLKKRPKRTELPREGYPEQVALSPDGKEVALLRRPGKRVVIDLWDTTAVPARLRTSVPLPKDDGKTSGLRHEGDRLLAFVGEMRKDDPLQVLRWDLSGPRPKELPRVTLALPPAETLKPGLRGSPVFTKGALIVPAEGGVYRWDLTTGKLTLPSGKAGHRGWVFCARFLPDGRRLLSGGKDQTIRLWEPQKGRFTERAVLQQGGDVFDLAVAPRRQLLASTGFLPANLRLWDLRALPPREREALPLVGDNPAWVSVFARDEKTLYTGTGLETLDDVVKAKGEDALRVWDVSGAKARKKAVVRGLEGAVMGLALSPDGKRLATAGGHTVYKSGEKREETSGLRLWDVTGAEPKEAAVLKGHTGVVYSVAFSPDGTLLASTGRDHTVRLWELSGKEPKEVAVLKRHEQPTYSVTFAPDGKTLASCDFSGRIVLWDVAGKTVRREWNLPGRVARVAFAPDGRHLASANANGTVYVFRLAPAPQ